MIGQANAMPLVSGLNGEVPPGRPTLLASSTLVVIAKHDGEQVRTYQDVRLAGTRAPIHVHPFGGWTCVVSGQTILCMEGVAPQMAHPGDCVDMPADTAMSNVNPGPGTTVLIDNFVRPGDGPIWGIMEKGDTHLRTRSANSRFARRNR